MLVAADRGNLAQSSAFALVCALALACILAGPVSAAPSPAAGEVRLVKDGGNTFDRFTNSPSRGQKALIRRLYSRLVVFSPYFNSRLRWYRRAWAYRDLYGMFPNSRAARRHPEWILRSGRGDKLYIPFECANGRCPQYAGDITNPRFRRNWIRGAKKLARRGYLGLYLDDVNMIRRVSLGDGVEVIPVSPRTGRRVGQRAWRQAVARFTRQIRRAVPGMEIVHNVIWFAPRSRDRLTRVQMRSADVIGLERGVNDAGLTGDGGQFGLTSFLDYVDWIHRRGRPVVFDEYAPSLEEQEYGLAGYMLINNGRDLLASEPATNPGATWRGYRVRLGAPRGKRRSWKGLLRRDFENGLVLLNPPGRPERTVTLDGSYAIAHSGQRISEVTLGASRAVIVVRAP